MTTGATGVWSAIATICCAGNSMATAWSNPSSLCKGCGLQDQEHNIGGHLTPWNHTHQVWYWFICVGSSQAGSSMRDSLIVSTEPLSLLSSTSERVYTQVSNVCRRIHPNLVDTHACLDIMGYLHTIAPQAEPLPIAYKQNPPLFLCRSPQLTHIRLSTRSVPHLHGNWHCCVHDSQT